MKGSVTKSRFSEPAINTGNRSRQEEVSGANPMCSGFTIGKRNRYWHVIDHKGVLVCVTVYKCGAKEVVRRLTA